MFPVDLVFHVSVMFLKFKSAVNWALILHSRICFLENYVPDAVIFYGKILFEMETLLASN